MIRIFIAAVAVLSLAAPAPGSKKPCRDAQGRVVACPEPKRPAPPRCKDERGRFVKCGTPDAKPERRG
jgi:hypothetical protein